MDSTVAIGYASLVVGPILFVLLAVGVIKRLFKKT